MASEQTSKEMHHVKGESGTGEQDQVAGKVSSAPVDLTEYRQMAQQNSIEAIRAAEERYNKAKVFGTAAVGDAKEAAVHGLGATKHVLGAAAYAASKKAAEAVDFVAEKGLQAKDAAVEGTHVAADFTAEKSTAAKDVAVEKGQQALRAAEDIAVSTGSTAAEKTQQIAGQTKDLVVEKTVQAKDATVSGVKATVEYTGEKVVQAKDMAVDATKRTAEYVNEKAVEAKEAALGAGQSTVEKTKEATDNAVGAVQKTVSLGGEKAPQAKDTALSAAQTAKDETKQASNEVMESTGEKAGEEKEYAREEAGQAKDASKSAMEHAGQKAKDGKEMGCLGMLERLGEQATKGGKGQESSDMGEADVEGVPKKVGENREIEKEGISIPVETVKLQVIEVEEKDGGILEAVGETLIGITQEATDLIGGRSSITKKHQE